MTLCDPFAINFLSTSGMKLVNHCVTQEGLARVISRYEEWNYITDTGMGCLLSWLLKNKHSPILSSLDL